MGVLKKYVCDKCGITTEGDVNDGTPEMDRWRVFGGFSFCPGCWRLYLETTKKYVEHFATVLGVEMSQTAIADGKVLLIASWPMEEALKDIRMAHNVWDVSIRDAPSTIKSNLDF